jgi:hypothetical protein
MSAANGCVELELERRWLERLVSLARASALGPVSDHIVHPASQVADSSVQRLDRQTTIRVAGDQRVEAPS